MSGVTIFKREKNPILDKINTKLFVNDVIKACQELDFFSLFIYTVEYPFKNVVQSEVKDFLDQADEYIAEWKENELILSIDSVEEFETKCIFCSLGKTVKAFNVTATKKISQKIPVEINYTKSFAINFEIVNEELVDFGWCNAFIEKDEIIKNNLIS